MILRRKSIKLFFFSVILILFISCKKSPEWHKTSNHCYVYAVANNHYTLKWEGSIKASLADGEGYLVSYDKNGKIVDKQNMTAVLGVASGWNYLPFRSYEYLGEQKKNAPNGFGVLVKQDSIFIGTFKNGKLYEHQCKIYQQLPTGKIVPCFIGVLKKGKAFGPAKYYENGQLCFEGSMKSGLRYGIGKEYKNNILIYEGFFKNGEKNGNGKQYNKNGLTYAGEWKNGLRHGFGKSYNENGLIVYEGEWAKGVYDGKGKLYENGQCIEGKWDEGLLTKSISSSVFSEIQHSTQRWLGNDSIDTKITSETSKNSIASSNIEFIEDLQVELNDYISKEFEKRVDRRFGFWHMFRMILQPWVRSDVKRAKYAESYFCKKLENKEIQQLINSKIDYFNKNNPDNQLQYVKLQTIESGSIVDANVAIKIFEREALETTDVLTGIVVDIVICVIIAFLIGIIVGLFFPVLVPYLFIVDFILTIVAFGSGLYLSIFKTSAVSIELEDQICTLLINNYLQYLNVNDIIPQILGLL